jgi:uncharacterized cupredoxin-like copper-binding protein
MKRTLALIVLLAACSAQDGSGDDYVLREWAIDGPSQLTADGAAALTVENAGEFPHTLVVTTEDGEVVAATGVVQPGEVASLEVDAAPGTYSFSCRIVTETDQGDLSDHYERGMHRTVVVVDR